MDLREQLDASIGEEPAHLPLEQRLNAGRRALRRRRVTTGIAAVAVAAVVGGTAWLTTGPGSPARDAKDVEVSATGGASPAPTQNAQTPPPVDFLGEPAMLVDGKVHLAAGWRELSRVPNPMSYQPPRHSIGLEVVKDGERKFTLVAELPDGSSVMTNSAVGDLQSWLPAKVDSQHELDVANGDAPTNGTNLPLVTLAEDGTLIPAPGVRIVEQVGDPDLGPGFAGPDDVTAAAKVRGPDERLTYVVVRRTGNAPTEVIPTTGRFGSLADFLEHARGEYTDGAGLR